MVAANEMIRSGRTSENGLSTVTESSAETMQASSIALARAEMEGSIVVAKKFPRNEDDARQRLMRSCERPRFADEVTYNYPRGGERIIGLSIYFAREAARLWGNIRYGYYIVRDDDQDRHIRCWAWDIETNTKVELDDTFRKLVQRKDRKTGKTTWMTPDERDLRELTGNRAARVVRNCILALLPEDLKAECEERSQLTLNTVGAQDPDAARKKIVDGFGRLNIPVAEIERYLGNKLAVATPKQLADLRQVWKALQEGNATWADYAPAAEPPASGPVSADSLTGGRATTGKPTSTAPEPKQKTPFEHLTEVIKRTASEAELGFAIEDFTKAASSEQLSVDEQHNLGDLIEAQRAHLQAEQAPKPGKKAK